MPVYKCPKCGRTVEKPLGVYYCVKCGPQVIMVKSDDPPANPQAATRTKIEIPERYPAGVKQLIREFITELSRRGFVIRTHTWDYSMTVDFYNPKLREMTKRHLMESGIYTWISPGTFMNYASTQTVGSLSIGISPDNILIVEGDLPVVMATAEKSDVFIRDGLRSLKVKFTEVHFHHWHGLPGVHIHIMGGVKVEDLDKVREFLDELLRIIILVNTISYKMLLPISYRMHLTTAPW